LREFAELASAAGHLHTYKITDHSLWAAAASGQNVDTLLDLFDQHSSMRAPAPAPRSTTTSSPAPVSVRSDSGVAATRRSPSARSRGTNTVVIADLLRNVAIGARLLRAGPWPGIGPER
jgi:hypothetical protein